MTKADFVRLAAPVSTHGILPGGCHMQLELKPEVRPSGICGWRLDREVLIVIGGMTYKAEWYGSIVIPKSKKWGP